MTSYCISLHRKNGSVRLKHEAELSAMESVWRQIHALSATHGEPGEYFEVSDESGGIVIRVGVMTTRTVTQSRLRAA